MSVTRRDSDKELSESLRHAADSGPVVTPGYAVMRRADWDHLLDVINFKIAWNRRKRGEPEEGVSLDELTEKYDL